MEKRFAAEIRTVQGRKLAGYAAIFNVQARIGNFTETVKPGAFRASLDKDILCLADHDKTRVLGRTKSGTLRLSEDARGLAFELDVPDTQSGRDILALAERGDLGGMSFGFTVPDEGQTWEGKHRTLSGVNLKEISVVSAWPAYEGTNVQARNKTPLLNKARYYMETL